MMQNPMKTNQLDNLRSCFLLSKRNLADTYDIVFYSRSARNRIRKLHSYSLLQR